MTTAVAHSTAVTALIDWATSMPTADWPQRAPIDLEAALIAQLLETRPHSRAVNPRLSAVLPGDSIALHMETGSPAWRYRIHVPLLTNPNAVFVTIDGSQHMFAGYAYEVDIRRPHAVYNRGRTPRLHFTVDIEATT